MYVLYFNFFGLGISSMCIQESVLIGLKEYGLLGMELEPGDNWSKKNILPTVLSLCPSKFIYPQVFPLFYASDSQSL